MKANRPPRVTREFLSVASNHDDLDDATLLIILERFRRTKALTTETAELMAANIELMDANIQKLREVVNAVAARGIPIMRLPDVLSHRHEHGIEEPVLH